MKPSRRRAGAVLASALVGMLLCLSVASNAQAAAYRYWTYWHVAGGAWQFAQTGPASATPADGSVEGWRYAVSTASGDPANAPGVVAAGAFGRICATTAPAAGSKRVALVVDPGPARQAPPGQAPGPLTTFCVVAPLDANGYDILRRVGPVRVGDGLICAINRYPSTGCADLVDDSEVTAPAAADAMNPAASPEESPAQASPVPVIVGLGALALLGILAWWLRRRR